MSQTVSEMFGYERESDDDTIIDNYDDSSSDISMPSDVTVDSDSDSHSESENDTDNNNNNNNDKVYTPLSEKCSQSRVIITTTTDSIGLYLY